MQLFDLQPTRLHTSAYLGQERCCAPAAPSLLLLLLLLLGPGAAPSQQRVNELYDEPVLPDGPVTPVGGGLKARDQRDGALQARNLRSAQGLGFGVQGGRGLEDATTQGRGTNDTPGSETGPRRKK